MISFNTQSPAQQMSSKHCWSQDQQLHHANYAIDAYGKQTHLDQQVVLAVHDSTKLPDVSRSSLQLSPRHSTWSIYHRHAERLIWIDTLRRCIANSIHSDHQAISTTVLTASGQNAKPRGARGMTQLPEPDSKHDPGRETCQRACCSSLDTSSSSASHFFLFTTIHYTPLSCFC